MSHTHTHAPAQHTHILLKWTFTATDPKWLLGVTKSSWNWQKISSEQRTSSFIRTRALTHQLSGVPRRAVLWRVCECVEHGACKTDNKCVSGDQKCDSQQSGKVHRRVTKSADRNSQREWTSLTHFSLFFPHSIVSVSLTALCPQAASHPPSLPQVSSHSLSPFLSLALCLSLLPTSEGNLRHVEHFTESFAPPANTTATKKWQRASHCDHVLAYHHHCYALTDHLKLWVQCCCCSHFLSQGIGCT